MSFFTKKSFSDLTSSELYKTQDMQTQQSCSSSTQFSQSTEFSEVSSRNLNFTIRVDPQKDFNIFGSQSQTTQFFKIPRLSLSQEQNGKENDQAELTFYENSSQLFDETSEEMDETENETLSTFYSAVSAETSSTYLDSTLSHSQGDDFTLQQAQSSQQTLSFKDDSQSQESSFCSQQQSQIQSGSSFSTERESQNLQRASSVILIDEDDETIQNINCLHVPPSITKLYKEVKENYSDWVFISLITGQLCIEWFPSPAYHDLKLCLLLSLVSINQSPIPIIAVGQETSHANIIMKHIGKFANRFVTSTLADFEKTSIKPNGTIEAGPLLMAKGGILFIGDWSRLNQKAVLKLLREIETGAVTTEKVQQRVPLECSIWSYWSNSTKAKKDFADINQFLNVFGIPILIDDFKNEEIIMEDLLNPVNDRKQIIAEKDLKQYFKYASAQHVAIEPIAEEMLNKYFKSTRAVRPQALSSQALTILKQLAESHAKLCCRNIVNPSDALAAINISEKYIRVLFKTDLHSSPAEPKIEKLADIDEYKKNLYEWFECFTRDNIYC